MVWARLVFGVVLSVISAAMPGGATAQQAPARAAINHLPPAASPRRNHRVVRAVNGVRQGNPAGLAGGMR
jgi:hypothetical protein